MRKMTPADIESLEDFLLGLDEDAMLISGLDGFMAGIVVCPDLILPSEWLPAVWGEGGPAFADEHHASRILSLIMGRYNEIARCLMPRGRYRPILEPDTDGTYLWELWAEGFAAALALRDEDTWRAFETSESEDVSAAFGFLAMLASFAVANERLERDLDRELRKSGDRLIALSLKTLNAARMKAHPVRPTAAAADVGRNSPCPCSSGKKFKMCCLN